MAGPWEKFGGVTPAPTTPPDDTPRGPWEKFAQSPTPSPTQTQSPSPAPQQADPYAGLDANHREARQYLDQHPEAQLGYGKSVALKALQGPSFGWGDEAVAAAAAARDWIKHPGQHSLGHYYDREKAMQDEMLRRASEKTGWVGDAAEVLGGLGTGIGLAKGGLTLARAGQGLLGKIGAGAAEGAAYGGVAGAGTNDENRLEGFGKGAATGLVLGGAAPVAVEAVRVPTAKVASWVSASRDPAAYAERQLARTVERSGKTPAQIEADIAAAKSAGQENYTVADALGESGQKQLGGLMTLPGAAKSDAAGWLSARNSGMGRNVQGYVDDAFNTHGNTAQEYSELMEAARSKAGDIRYRAARESAGPVDLSNTMQTLEGLRDPAGVMPGGVPSRAQSAAPGSVENAAQLLGADALGDTTSANFNLILDRKRQIGDMIEEAVRKGRKYEASQLMQVSKELDAALENASPGYRRANDTFHRMSRPIDAIPVGQKAATSGRSADNINKFEKMGLPSQQGFRVGYADKLNESLGGPTVGRKLNEMLHGDVADEIGAFATPGRADPFRERLTRADTMVRTGNIANGGSATAERLGQQADVGIDPVTVAQTVASGSPAQIAKMLWSYADNYYGGNIEAVRNQLIPMLLSGKVGNGQTANLTAALDALARGRARSQGIDAAVRSGVSNFAVPAFVEQVYAKSDNASPMPVTVTQENIDAFNARNPARLLEQPGVARAGDGYVQRRAPAASPQVEYRNKR